jgi:polysaccharide pyruvyl transferase WcaK-like protein
MARDMTKSRRVLPRPFFAKPAAYTAKAKRLIRVLTTRSDRYAKYIGWVDHHNLGDEALFEATTNYFEPRYRIRYCPTFTNRLAGSLLDARRPDMLILGGGTLIGAGRLWRTFAESAGVARRDIVFGSGVLFDPTSGRPVSSGSELRKTLGRCDYVGVRGEISAEALWDAGVESEVLGDPAIRFLLKRPPPRYSNRVLGVNFGRTGAMWGDPDDLALVVTGALRVLRSHGWRFRFFVVWPNDLSPTLELISRAGISEASSVVRECRSARRFVKDVSELPAFIGFRLHSVVLAMCAHTPSLMLAYRQKGFDFMRSVGMADYAIGTDVATTAWIVDHVEGAEFVPVARATARMAFLKRLQERRAQDMGASGILDKTD